MNTPLGFGAIEREQNLSDFHLGALSPTPAPAIYMPDYTMPIEMQAQQPACGSHAGSVVENFYNKFRVSPEYLWKKIKLIDGFPISAGTSMDAIMKVLQKNGVCSFDLLPNNPNVSLESYADPSVITPQMDSDASTRKLGTYAFQFNPSFQDIKNAIYNHGAVIMLLRVGQEWWVPSWAEKDILPLKTDQSISSGHFVTAFAYDEKYIYFVNSWSDAWGRKGIGYFGEDYAPRCVEIGTIVKTTYTFTKLLKQGMSGTDVGMLQKKLKDLGFFNVSITSYFGSITKQAVEKFQKAHNLTPDGIVGPLTNAVLNTL